MIRHLIRIVWNLRRRNWLLGLEILCAFLVLVAVLGYGFHAVQRWRQPLGFSIADVWAVQARPQGAQLDRETATVRMEQLLAAVRDVPQVRAAAGVSFGAMPYGDGASSSVEVLEDGRRYLFAQGGASDDFADVVDLNVVAGRWFSREDDAASSVPVVISARMAREVFGDRDPVGAVIPVARTPRRDGSIPEPMQVVGVIEEFRRRGELWPVEPFLFYRAHSATVARTAMAPPIDALVLSMAPGTTAAAEQELLARLRAELPDWSFEVETVEQQRAAQVSDFRIALLVSGTIAAFLLLMVALGLTGVVWQSVTERIREFGLRRAKGASAADIRRQVLAELAVLTSMAVALGLAIVLQVAALPLPVAVVARVLSRPVGAGESTRMFWSGSLAAGVAAAVVLVYAITLLCAWYPSRLATRIRPAEALHYE